MGVGMDNHPPDATHIRSGVCLWWHRCLRWFQSRLSSDPRACSLGQGLVEFALVLPLLLLVMLGVIEFSYAFAVYSGLFNAAREGARYGVVNPRDQWGIISSARSKIFLVDPTGVSISVRYDDGPGTEVYTDTERVEVGDRVLVHLVYDLPTITPVIQPVIPAFHVETAAARTITTLGQEPPAPGPPMPPPPPPSDSDGDGVPDDQDICPGFDDTSDVDGDGVPDGCDNCPIVANPDQVDTDENGVGDACEGGGGGGGGGSGILDLTVTADPQTIYPGEQVTFIYTVQNIGDVDLTDVVVTPTLGTPLGPLQTLAPGESVFWQVSYHIYETTDNFVIATGIDPLGGTASDSAAVTVFVVEELDPIVIHEPLSEGSTVVTGTAQAGRTVSIRDLMDDTFPSISAVVQADGTFEFAGLPPLIAGHVIVVEGYGQWDSAAVGDVVGDADPIVINEPLCHDDTVVGGTAEPEQAVTLVIVGTPYRDSTVVDAAGSFTFTLPSGQPLQDGQTIRVGGYGLTASAIVGACTTDPYIVISPQCGGPSPPDVTITVDGYNWPTHSRHRTIKLYWDGAFELEFPSTSSSFTTDLTKPVSEGAHTIRVEVLWKGSLEDWREATFLSPCPAPNLVVTDLSLLTTAPISTYQPIDFSVTVENIGTMPVNNLFWVDLYSGEPTPPTAGIAWGAVSGLSVGDSTTFVITLNDGFEITSTYPIWAFADSWDQVGELNEEDNGYGPVTVDVTEEGTPPPTPPITTTIGSIEGETWVSLAGIPVPHGRANVSCVDAEGTVVASTVSDEEGLYEFLDLAPGVYTVIGETWIDGIRYSNTYEVEVVADESTVLFVIMYED